MSTRTITGKKAREAVLAGVNAIAVPVSLTIGPHARKALMYRTYNRGSRIVDDGHIVAQCQEPRDPFIRLVAEAFKEACQRTNEKVGDGTATTGVVGGRLYNDLHSLFIENTSDMVAKNNSGSSRMGVSTIRAKVLESANRIQEAIRKSAIKIETVEQLANIATVSVGGDAKLGAIIAKMAWDVGVDGFIDVVEGYKGEIETEVIKGFRFPAKPAAKAFVNNPSRYEMVAKDVPVLITNYALDNGGDVAPMMRKLNEGTPQGGGTSKIVIIAPSFSDSVLVGLVNAAKQGYFIHAVKVPSIRTEQFEDLATYCGARFIDKNKGATLRGVTSNDLGFLEKLIVKDTENREDAMATGGRGAIESEQNYVDLEGGDKTKGIKPKKIAKTRKSSPVQDRIEVLKGQLAETQQENFKKLLERRIASMASSVGIIRVGDSTQASSLDRKLKIEDAVYACKAAIRGGYVKGGGLCLYEIAKTLPDDDFLKAAISEPYNRIQGSVDGGLEIGPDIIDPAEAEIYAVEHAAGVVANLITVEIITVQHEEVSMGDGLNAVAREVGMISLSMRKAQGQLSENEAEMEKDRLGGLTVDEKIMLDQG